MGELILVGEGVGEGVRDRMRSKSYINPENKQIYFTNGAYEIQNILTAELLF